MELDPQTLALFTVNLSNKDRFFVETPDYGNYIWDESKQTLSVFKGSYKDWCRAENITHGKRIGHFFIDGYCGTKFKIIKGE
jgi:hypothetical protein